MYLTPYAYPSLPLISVKTWDLAQRMDVGCLQTMRLTAAGADANDKFGAWVEHAVHGWMEDNECVAVDNRVTLRDIWPYSTISKNNNATRFHEVVMPRNEFVLWAKEREGDDWDAMVQTRLDEFLDICHTPKKPGNMQKMIRLSEDFFLLEVLSKKWGDAIRHKCSCPHFIRKAECEHAVVLAMIMDPTVVPPGKADIRVINQRRAKKRGRPSGEGDSDSLEERRKKPPPPKRRPEPQLANGLLLDSEDEPVSGLRMINLTILQCAD